jgi:hypothetical protein
VFDVSSPLFHIPLIFGFDSQTLTLTLSLSFLLYCSSVASYSTVVGMAAQSGRYSASMQYHVSVMTKVASEAVVLQESAVVDSAKATEGSAKAIAAENESQALEAKAVALEAQAETLEVYAVEDEETAKALEVKAGEEQVAAEVAGARAAVDEIVANEEEAVATEAAGAAAEFEVEELQDGTAIMVCEFIPLLDVVCDVIGGIAEVSFTTAAVAEVAEAVAATTAIAAVREAEEVAVAEAAESEASVAVDGEAAASLETKAEIEEAEALTDQEEANRDEAEAEALQVEAEEAEEMATEEETKAEVEEADADVSLEKAAQHGLSAAQEAIMSSAAGLLALSYFGVKFVTRLLGGFTTFTATAASTIFNEPRSFKLCYCLPRTLVHDLSYIFLHLLIFLSTSVSLLNHIEPSQILGSSATYSIRSQGGLLLIFGLVAATVQCFMLHALPNAVRQSYPVWEWIALSAFLLLLFIMEALIVLVNLGRTSIQSSTLENVCQVPVLLIWGGLLSFVAIHLHVCRAGRDATEQEETEDREIIDCELELNEKTSLLGSSQDTASNVSDRQTSIAYSWLNLLIPLEILVLSCLVPILASCFSHTQILWPLLHNWVSGIEWAIPVVFVVYLGLVVLVMWWSTRREQLS